MMKNLTEALDYGLSKGCDDVELYIEKSQDLEIELRNGKIDKYQESKSKGIGVRVIKGKRQSLVYGTSDDDQKIRSAIDEALEIIQYMDEDEIVLRENDQYSGEIDYKGIEESTYEQKMEYLSRQEKDGVGSDSIKAVVESTSYQENKYSKRIINTRGLDKTETGAYCGSSISLAISQNSTNETGYSYFYSRDIDGLFRQNLGAEAYERAYEMIGAEIVDSKKYTALFIPDVVADLLRLLAYSFNGENIYKGKSLFKDKTGMQVISDKIDIIDDGTEESALGFTFFDGDGTPARKNAIIEKGVFTGGLYNLSIARKENKITTGNASRSYSGLPNIGYHNLFVKNGDTDTKDMLKDLQEGLIIKDLMGLHMANPITGEFSLGAAGIVVKNGKQVRGFRGVTISGNILDLFNNVLAVGNDFQRRTSLGSPSLMIKDVIISGS